MSKSEVASERKQQIVTATVECITRHGYHNFSMQDVANTAGVSKGIIHYYFLNKDDLMMAVLEQVATNIELVLQSCMTNHSDPEEQLRALVHILLDIARSSKEYYQVSMDFWTQINQKPEIHAVIAKHYQKFRETCIRVIQSGIDKQIFAPIDPFEYSSYLIAIADGLSLQWLFDPESFNNGIQKHVLEWAIEPLKKT
ncbi:MAG: TetR/AcrR family transcriptional regulator [Oligoflexales bacterium]